ncbi:MAG: MFS transporter [Parvibaculaceae bacterium]
MTQPTHHPGDPAPASERSLAPLASLNFTLADVRDGLGPFLGVFLLGKGWGPDWIGYVMTAGGIAGMLATTPLGMFTDATRAKRLLIAICAGLVVVASLALLLSSSLAVVTASQIATGIAGAAIAPALAGVTLGLVGQERLPRQLGRNEAWNHAGNVAAAVLAGLLGYRFGLPAVFALMTLLAVASIVSVFTIRESDIDHDVARGLEPGEAKRENVPGFGVLLRSIPLLTVGLTMLLFHLGNAAMLPLLSQAVVAEKLANASAFTAVTVVVAQLTMVPVALAAARVADRSGYWWLVVLALAVLPVRGLIAGYWTDPWAVIPVQVLDGVGAGLLGVATPGLVAQLLRGTGHVNAGLGAVMTMQGVGAALSPALAGYVAHVTGYSEAFLFLSGIAGVGLVFWIAATLASRSLYDRRNALEPEGFA